MTEILELDPKKLTQDLQAKALIPPMREEDRVDIEVSLPPERRSFWSALNNILETVICLLILTWSVGSGDLLAAAVCGLWLNRILRGQ